MKAVPAVFYGTAWKKQKTAELVCLALKSGFRGIDTACQPKHYNQPGVGQGIAQSGIPRSQIFIQTKFTSYNGQDPNNIPYNPKDNLPTQVRTSLAVSLKNLRTQYLDSLVMHSPMSTLQKTIQVWTVFQEFFKQGKVKALGLSNCYSFQFFSNFYESVAVKPSFLQNRFYAQSHYDKELRAFCKEKGIIYQSFWTLTANPHIMQSKEMSALIKKYKKTPAQLMYATLIGQGIIPLIGTTSKQHMIQDLEIVGLQLPKEERQAILSLCK